MNLFSLVTSSISVKGLIIGFAIIVRIICNLLYYHTTFRSHYNTITHTLNHRIVDWFEKGDGHEFQSYPPLYGYIYYFIGLVQSAVLETPHNELMSGDIQSDIEHTLDYRISNYICIMFLTLLEAFTLYAGVYM